jgi:DNA polymerase-1
METIKAQAFELAGNAFNLESPKQIQQILFSESNFIISAILFLPFRK